MMMIKIILYLLFIGLNIAMARLHNKMRIDAIKAGTKAISHGWWALIYAAVCFAPVHWYVDWFLYSSLILLHLSIFPVAYNLYTGNLSAWHLSTTSTAITDRIMVRMGLKSTEAVNIAAQIISISLFIISIHVSK